MENIFKFKLTLIILSYVTLVACGGASDEASQAPLGQQVPTQNPLPNQNPPQNTNGGVVAFPGAQGFGAKATGGRFGRVIKVTNLNASGSGSLQDALNQNEARIIVFDVSGVITANIISIPYGNVTIAGQTAPGAGITIEGRLYSDYRTGIDNIIIRHIRIRPPEFDPNIHGAASQYDAMQFSLNKRLILDHVSVSFGVDESIDLYEATDVTIQWSNIQEAATSIYHETPTHNYGMLNGPNGKNISIHHNLFAHNNNRNPALASGPAEVVNNVIYNVKHGFVHHNPAKGKFNIVGNYYKDGPSSAIIPFYFDDENNGNDSTLEYYLADNYVDDPGNYVGVVSNPWLTPYSHSSFANLVMPESKRSTQLFDFSNNGNYIPIIIDDSNSAYNIVLNYSGSFPRDIVDQRDVIDTRDRTGNWGARIPVNLLQGLTAIAPPTDTDNDGIPDAWEISNGLNPSIIDNDTIMTSGYTAIEDYINQLADAIIQN